MTYIAICETHSGGQTTKWLDNCEDFWDAVIKATALAQVPVPIPPQPPIVKGNEHLRRAELHEWSRECTRVLVKNDDKVKKVLALKPWLK